jgi:uncharacterized protein (DUF302 family)
MSPAPAEHGSTTEYGIAIMADEIEYGFKKTVDGTIDQVEPRVREALKGEGFGVLSEIDIRAAFAEKLGVDFRPYRILGACNPPLAHAALTEETDIGLLLPCNVVVYEADDPSKSVVAILDPVKQLGIAGRDDLGDLAVDVRGRLGRVIAGL